MHASSHLAGTHLKEVLERPYWSRYLVVEKSEVERVRHSCNTHMTLLTFPCTPIGREGGRKEG